MSQRFLIRTMGAEEIMDWMAYDLSNIPEFREKVALIPIVSSSHEEEAKAIKYMLMNIGKPK